MAEAGVDTKVSAEVMGHSDPRITLKAYNRVLPERKRAAATKLDSILQGTSKAAGE